uniref:Uncharacterized protein n=1 Tax=Schizaphis graminum TaxID=13262 RepID=A0A2S2NRV7_SCHGA
MSNCGNGNTAGRANYKPPQPLPPADASLSPLSSLIHRSPNGGYVSLLRRSAVPESDAVTGRPTAAVRFNSLQRPDRGSTTAWQRRDRQFRSMRTVGTGGGSDGPVAAKPTVGDDRLGRQDNNNNNDSDKAGGGGGVGGGVDETKASAATADRGDGRKNAFSASTFPKPAPRTRVPSASVAPPSLSRRDTYENLQQLLNGSDGSVIGTNKVRTYIGGLRRSHWI